MQDSSRSPLTQATDFIKNHSRLYAAVLLFYGLILFPWLRAQGHQLLGSLIGVVLLAGMLVVFRANLDKARETLRERNDDERRGF
ncbi:hypothetical protein [Haloarchaeobius sp. TZWWS8]|uniref:hypothetical protein n=1 Tax=Haloarchaeobius sp. TZWWS8 TaxID=3446121 RepID=UPI003EBF1C49